MGISSRVRRTSRRVSSGLTAIGLVAGVLAVSAGSVSAADPASYNLAGVEYAATSTAGSFAGAAVSVTRDDMGLWKAVVIHTPLSPSGATITGGTFDLDGKIRDYEGTITGGTLVPLTTGCAKATFAVKGTFAAAGGTGSFDVTLSHYGLRTRTGCRTYAASVRGSASFVPEATPSERILVVAYTNVDGLPGFDPATDVLIAKLVDTNGDASVSAGDTVVTERYPKAFDFATAGFGNFTATTHIVASVLNATADSNGVVVTNAVGDQFAWIHTTNTGGLNELDLWGERDALNTTNTYVFDVFGLQACPRDEIVSDVASPSAPDATVSPSRCNTTGDDPFLDVQYSL